MRIVSMTERPELVPAVSKLPNQWPTFMQQSPTAHRLYGPMLETFGELQLIMVEGARPIAFLHAVPIAWDGPEALPDRGWDAALEGAFRLPGPTPAVSLIEARIDPNRTGQGLSMMLLNAARERIRDLGYQHLVGPVRPNQKLTEPLTPMAEYAARVRPDGLPVDAWLRTHVRIGGKIIKVCPLSMIIPGTLDQWRGWTGLPFDRSGDIEVPGGVAPVHVSVEQDHAVYVEPNVWVHHPLV
ncbi:MAG: N-acetyltransferase [Microlunatus sp.]|nr:N-acetyltransferase [Microlunatus sp.]